MCTRPITRKYFMQAALLLGNVGWQLVANFREFFHLHPWCQQDCGQSLLSTIALFSVYCVLTLCILLCVLFVFTYGLFVLIVLVGIAFYVCLFYSRNGVRLLHLNKGYLTWLDLRSWWQQGYTMHMHFAFCSTQKKTLKLVNNYDKWITMPTDLRNQHLNK